MDLRDDTTRSETPKKCESNEDHARVIPGIPVASNNTHSSSTEVQYDVQSLGTIPQAPLRSNRFSLTFPILPTSKETSPTRTIQESTTLESFKSTDGNFLTAIAAQERRVLEIKEELQRAEAELNKLKLQWASHEAQKKKNEVKRTTKLRPLSTQLSSVEKDGITNPSIWLQHEMERRKTLLAGARTSSRRVFSGSKHARTLSLLSPVNTTNDTIPPARPRGATSPVKSKAKIDGLPRAITAPNLTTEASNNKLDNSSIDKDLLLKTGKKMAMDLKDGIWTFWEDLRQATVGEDMVQIIPPEHVRRQSSSQTLRTPRRGGSRSSVRGSSRGSNSSRASIARSPDLRRASPKKAQEAPLFDETIPTLAIKQTPITSKTTKHTKAPSVAVSVASSDAFDAWDDSPKASRSSSATSESTSRPSPSSKDASPSTRGTARDPIPWPNIAKFDTATLRRTASHLMSEWNSLEVKDECNVQGYIDAGDLRAKKQD